MVAVTTPELPVSSVTFARRTESIEAMLERFWRWSRRGAFLGAFILSLLVTAFVFYSLRSAAQAYWMLPMMGFAQLAIFAGYAIYFPELFPTRLRGTGVGFCYNTVRYLAAPFPFLLGWLNDWCLAWWMAFQFQMDP